MPWCPKCETEYREGILKCADCGSDLVDELSVSTEDFDEIYEPAFLSSDTNELKEMTEEEALALFEETKKEAIERRKRLAESPGLYIESSRKAQDFKSGGFSLLFVGIIGFIFILMIIFGIIPLHMNLFSKYLIIGVMGPLFILFIVMGLLSIKSYKKFEIKANEEDNLTKQLTSWCKENIISESIDSDLEEANEELLYFSRTEKMKELITHKFMNLDEAFLDSFIDDIYPEIFQ